MGGAEAQDEEKLGGEEGTDNGENDSTSLSKTPDGGTAMISMEEGHPLIVSMGW